MGDILDEAQEVVQCKTCPWYKACVLPMRFTEEDIKKQLSAAQGSIIPGGTGMEMQQLMAGMAAAAQNTILEGCPVFINRLRTSPRLAERIKKLMQEWADEQEDRSQGQSPG
ncbi:MAG TPA: hypothetical protein VJ488_02340 [Dehalococcoidia bacterium]|nr:hypothetical protein [Dehalococcoidia bacterium]